MTEEEKQGLARTGGFALAAFYLSGAACFSMIEYHANDPRLIEIISQAIDRALATCTHPDASAYLTAFRDSLPKMPARSH